VKERLAKINTSMSTLTGRVDDMGKDIEGLESVGDFGEHCVEMQVLGNSVVADVNKEI